MKSIAYFGRFVKKPKSVEVSWTWRKMQSMMETENLISIMEITYESLSAENHQKKIKAAGMEALYHPIGNHFFPARPHPCADHGRNAHRGL